MTPWETPDGARWETRGEAAVARELRTEKREGVDHYVPGQVHAELQGPEEGGILVAQLSFVNRVGVCMLAMVSVDGREWEPAVRGYRCVGLGMDYGMSGLPDCWEPTEEMLAALNALKEES